MSARAGGAFGLVHRTCAERRPEWPELRLGCVVAGWVDWIILPMWLDNLAGILYSFPMTADATYRDQVMAPLTEARDRLSEIVDDVASTGVDLIITKFGRPTAVVIGYDEYESLIETLNILSDADAMEALGEAELDVAAGETSPLE